MASDTRSTWRLARVLANRKVADGSMWLSLEAVDHLPAEFEPGHVLGLGLHIGGAIQRHAYTVSRGIPSARRFEHLYRIIPQGRLSPLLARLSPGDTVYFHGPFHTPIQDEIQSDAERIVLVSTGTGIGPVFGYAEKALRDGEQRPVMLCAGFREESETCLSRELNELSAAHENFAWHFTLSRPSTSWTGLTGRVTECVPYLINRQHLRSCHFHLVGNGEMVHLVRDALHRAGVPAAQVSIETYFNHYVRPASDAVDELASRFRNQ